MTRYDSAMEIDNVVDHEKVQDALSMLVAYCTDVTLRCHKNMNVTVDNGNIFLYSRKEAHTRYFVEVKSSTNSVKIILASAESDLRMTKVQPCQDPQENGRSVI